ncbi:peritrophin-44-like [Anopheles cruzii]|uniref:peritrophin-44-like n=1 Tax=Anopheles cruzii TaxID=68878 RepID=UPI0022EC4DE3|nr:peritrophin-44-like [Anopheles cruzii]
MKQSTRILGLLALVAIAFIGSSVANDACKGVPTGYFVRDKTNCKGYYYCQNGTPTHNLCPGGYYFNELAQMCDFADKVSCHICQQQTGMQVAIHPQNCSQFIMCSEGYSTVGQCAEGFQFDSQQRACNPAKRVTCKTVRCPTQSNPGKIVYLPGVESCEEYFICQSGTAIRKYCAPGLYWDAAKERCDLAQKVSCKL